MYFFVVYAHFFLGEKNMTGVGFEPTPPKRLVPKTSALDHSANQSSRCGDWESTFIFWTGHGGLAQLVECDVRNVEAAGSKPAFSSFVAVLFFVLGPNNRRCEREKKEGAGGELNPRPLVP